MKSKLLPSLAICGISVLSGITADGAALSTYTNFVTYNIDVSEASAVTYNRDTGTLFAIGDEGEALVQLSKTGQLIDRMTFDNSRPRGQRALDDPEGVTYLGNGKFMIADERIGTGWVTTYQAGTQIAPGVMTSFILDGTSGPNTGLEGVAYDPLTDSVWGVKEASPVSIYQQSNINGGGPSVTSSPFPGNRFSREAITSLSDIYVMAASAAFADEDPRRNNLLILSRGNNVLLEMTRTGEVVDCLDLGFLGKDTIEGVTMDDEGNIYLVSEASSTAGDNLHVLSAIPEPSGLVIGLLGSLLVLRRRRN